MKKLVFATLAILALATVAKAETYETVGLFGKRTVTTREVVPTVVQQQRVVTERKVVNVPTVVEQQRVVTENVTVPTVVERKYVVRQPREKVVVVRTPVVVVQPPVYVVPKRAYIYEVR